MAATQRHYDIVNLYVWPVACVRPKPGPFAARADRLEAFNNESD